MGLNEKLEKITGIITDVDGVLTDGGIILDGKGQEYKIFNVKDGNGIKIWMKSGFKLAFLSGRVSKPVLKRGEELGVDEVILGSRDKIKDGEGILKSWRLNWENIAYIGDDIVDIPVMEKAGVSFTVNDAVAEAKEAADIILNNVGGHGALREMVEIILKEKGLWDGVLSKFIKKENQTT